MSRRLTRIQPNHSHSYATQVLFATGDGRTLLHPQSEASSTATARLTNGENLDQTLLRCEHNRCECLRVAAVRPLNNQNQDVPCPVPATSMGRRYFISQRLL